MIIRQQFSGILVLSFLLGIGQAPARAATDASEMLLVPGLSQPVEILRDR
jgi:hypothetical protein